MKPKYEKQRRSESPRSIRLPESFEKHIEEIADNLSPEAETLLASLPDDVLNLTQKKPKIPFNGLIEFAIIRGIESIRKQYTPNVKPYQPFDDLEARDHKSKHQAQSNLAIIAQAMKRHPQLAGSLYSNLESYREKPLTLQLIIDLLKEFESNFNELNKLKRETAELKENQTSPPGTQRDTPGNITSDTSN